MSRLPRLSASLRHRSTVRPHVEFVFGRAWNSCSVCRGTRVRLVVESVFGLAWNTHTETIMAFSRRALNGHEGSSASTSLRHSGVRSAQITDLRVGHGRAPGQTRTCDPARRSRASASEGISDTQVWARIHGQATITRQSSGAVRKRNKSYVSRAAHRIELTTFGCSRRAALIVDKRGTNMFPTIA
jgi:hypothetical protein